MLPGLVVSEREGWIEIDTDMREGRKLKTGKKGKVERKVPYKNYHD